MSRIPQPHLSPDSTPWGRWASNEIEALRREGSRVAEANLNGAKAQNAALAQAAKQIVELQAAQQDLAAQTATLTLTQTSLAAAQSDLATQASSLTITQTSLAAAQQDLTTTQTSLATQATSLSTQTTKLASAVTQLNAASESKSTSALFVSGGANDAQPARSNFEASVVTFTRPSWATKATVMATGQVSATGTENGPSQFTALAVQIAGTSSPNQSANIKAPGTGEIRFAGSATDYIPYINTPSALVIPYARSFATSSSSINCGIMLTKNSTGIGHGFFLSVAATVFWSAN